MSDDLAGVRRTNLIAALRRAFTGLDELPGIAAQIADDLILEKVAFADVPLELERNFSSDDPRLHAFLVNMGDWQEVLVRAIDSRIRSLRWAPEHQFLYVSRVA
jgi:hypothetical protein